jgi:hypothetical protein
VVSFHIDRIVGLHRTPAVVPRFFGRDELERLARESGQEAGMKDGLPTDDGPTAIASIINQCGTGNIRTVSTGAEGAMVGWSPAVVRELTHNRTLYMADLLHPPNTQEKGKYMDKRFRITKNSRTSDIAWVMESMYFNMYVSSTEAVRCTH